LHRRAADSIKHRGNHPVACVHKGDNSRSPPAPHSPVGRHAPRPASAPSSCCGPGGPKAWWVLYAGRCLAGPLPPLPRPAAACTAGSAQARPRCCCCCCCCCCSGWVQATAAHHHAQPTHCPRQAVVAAQPPCCPTHGRAQHTARNSHSPHTKPDSESACRRAAHPAAPHGLRAQHSRRSAAVNELQGGEAHAWTLSGGRLW
jgi:hypothetical protein